MKTDILPLHQTLIYLKGVQNYTELHYADGSKQISSYTLLRHQEKLDGFLRVNKSHLLNPHFISKIFTDGTTKEVLLKTGQCVKVSRRSLVSDFGNKTGFIQMKPVSGSAPKKIDQYIGETMISTK